MFLHGLWDMMGPLSTAFALLVTGVGLTQRSVPQSVASAVEGVATGSYITGLAIISVLGVLALRHWGRRTAAQRVPVAVPAGTDADY